MTCIIIIESLFTFNELHHSLVVVPVDDDGFFFFLVQGDASNACDCCKRENIRHALGVEPYNPESLEIADEIGVLVPTVAKDSSWDLSSAMPDVG